MSKQDYKVKDISLAEYGRQEILLAQDEMPALMQLRDNYKDQQPLKGAKITISNNAKITINGANKFQFELSGNITSGKKGNLYNYDELVALITEELRINEDIVSINKNLIVSEGNLFLRKNSICKENPVILTTSIKWKNN